MQAAQGFEKASNWFLNSEIQNSNGSFSAWIDLKNGKNSFEYSEITGYALTALVSLKSEAAKEKAEKAANWLKEKAVTEEGAVLARNYMEWEQANPKFSFEGRNCYAFDAGMVLNGLMELHASTGKQLDIALKVGSFLVEKMFKQGKMNAVYNLEEGKELDSGEKWSLQPGSYHSKNAIGLLKLAKATKEKKLEETAIALCEFALTKQLPEGRFVTNAWDKSTHLHPHCYSAEGLLYAGQKLGEERYIEAAEKATAWAFENQAENKGINAFFDGGWNESQRSDVLAQVLRLGIALKKDGRLKTVGEEKINALAQRLLEFQHETGGLLYGKELDLSEKNCVNAWCTMFAMQALQWLNAEKIDFGGVI